MAVGIHSCGGQRVFWVAPILHDGHVAVVELEVLGLVLRLGELVHPADVKLREPGALEPGSLDLLAGDEAHEPAVSRHVAGGAEEDRRGGSVGPRVVRGLWGREHFTFLSKHGGGVLLHVQAPSRDNLARAEDARDAVLRRECVPPQEHEPVHAAVHDPRHLLVGDGRADGPHLLLRRADLPLDVRDVLTSAHSLHVRAHVPFDVLELRIPMDLADAELLAPIKVYYEV